VLEFGDDSSGLETVTIKLPTPSERSFSWMAGDTSTTVEGTYTPPSTSITTIEVFDSLGRTHEVVTHFRRIDDSRWEWWAEDAAGNRLNDDPSQPNGILVFDSRGRL